MRTDLRFRRFWLTFGWAAVSIALVVSLLPAQAVEIPNANDKLEHLFGYFMLTIWFCGIYPRRQYPLIALAMILMGGLVEVLQALMNLGRHAEFNDLVADTVGICMAVVLAMTPLGNWPRWIESLIKRNG